MIYGKSNPERRGQSDLAAHYEESPSNQDRETQSSEAKEMNPHNWQEVALAFVTALPAIIAACIGLRNGKKIDAHDEWERNGKPGVKKNLEDGDTASNPDWYKAPDLLNDEEQYPRFVAWLDQQSGRNS